MAYPNRTLPRLKNYNYSTPGAYFITICSRNHRKLFGEIVGEDWLQVPLMQLSAIGNIINDEICAIETHYTTVILEKYTIMPNHLHMIIRITERINPFPTACDIPNVVGKFKAAVTRRARREGRLPADIKLWQTSYHDHIIRGDTDYDAIWTYIDNNPAKWREDRFYTK